MISGAVELQPTGGSLTRGERADLILAFARALYINGESTHQTVGAAERLGRSLECRATVFPHWGELEIQVEDAEHKFVSAIAAAPSGVEMDRVASTLRAVEELGDGRLAPARAREAITRIEHAPPPPTWLFGLAAAAGAVALALLFGVRHLTAGALIF